MASKKSPKRNLIIALCALGAALVLAFVVLNIAILSWR